MDYTFVPTESRVDWLTLTTSDPTKRNQFLDFAAQILNSHEQPNDEARPWRWKGYAGLHKGHITFGRRDDSDIVQLSSEFAHIYFNEFYALADNCTRIDLAVTITCGVECGDYIRQHSEEVNAYREHNRPSLQTTLIYGNGTPETVYIGNRASDLFARIYDKGRESPGRGYDRCIRYEVEIKGAAAERCYSTLAARPDRPNWIQSAVQQYFCKRGTRPLFNGLDADVRINAIRPISSDTTRLRWLAETVRPTIERLLRVEKPEAIMAALGFPRTLDELVRLRKLIERGNHRDYLAEDEEETDG